MWTHHWARGPDIMPGATPVNELNPGSVDPISLCRDRRLQQVLLADRLPFPVQEQKRSQGPPMVTGPNRLCREKDPLAWLYDVQIEDRGGWTAPPQRASTPPQHDPCRDTPQERHFTPEREVRIQLCRTRDGRDEGLGVHESGKARVHGAVALPQSAQEELVGQGIASAVANLYPRGRVPSNAAAKPPSLEFKTFTGRHQDRLRRHFGPAPRPVVACPVEDQLRAQPPKHQTPFEGELGGGRVFSIEGNEGGLQASGHRERGSSLTRLKRRYHGTRGDGYVIPRAIPSSIPGDASMLHHGLSYVSRPD